MSQKIRRLGLVIGLGGAVVIGWSQVALVLAAPMPKVGIAYQTSGGQGIANANYTVVADMVVPAGKYHVTARGTVNNQTGVPVDYVACNAYVGVNPIDSGTTSAPFQYAGFAIDGVGDLPAGGTIRVECISSVGSAPLPNVGISLVADSMAGISTLP
jgi:hypothetical protein